MASSAPTSDTIQPRDTLYCQVCTFPPEYCEFGSHATKCKAWLHDAHPSLYEKYYSADALQSKMQSLSVEAQSKLAKDTAKKEAKADAKADAEAKKKKASKVTIKRIQRNKNKYVTSIHGLEAFGIDLKKAAKLLAQKFATGSSVTKNPQGLDEIVVQGDVSDDVCEIIEQASTGAGGQLGTLFKAVPIDNVVTVEDTKKKGAAAGE